MDSNPVRLGSEADALTARTRRTLPFLSMLLSSLIITDSRDFFFGERKKIPVPGIEPGTSGLADKRSNHWTMWTYLVDDKVAIVIY